MFCGLYESLIQKKTSLAVTGLGYVGIPIAVAFSKHLSVIGYDKNSEKIALYNKGIDPTREIGSDGIAACSVSFTDDESKLKNARFHIIAVPTPVYDDHTPDLTALETASETVGRNLQKGSIVVYESTVYPGVTEEVCVPILERASGLVCGKDFKVGYSPERINPGDKNHRLENIVKIVSGIDTEALDIIKSVYELIIEAGIYPARSIKIAEAAKVIENSQRDINIAFMNELSIIFNKMGLDTKSVLEAAGTKWNFMPFYPGLVGGHCTGVDPYYLTYKADKLGYHSQVILAGRRINDDMGRYVARTCVKSLDPSKPTKDAKVAVLGFTFKENCPDTRNTKVYDIIKELSEFGISPVVCDPVADADEMKKLYDIDCVRPEDIREMDAVIIAVAHECFKDIDVREMLGGESKLIFDIKGTLDRESLEAQGYKYWRL